MSRYFKDYTEAAEAAREREWEERCNRENEEEDFMEEFDRWYDEQKDNAKTKKEEK